MTHLKGTAIGLVAPLIGVSIFTFAANPPATLPTTHTTTRPATTQSTPDLQMQMKEWWETLAKPEPFCTKALLDFSAHPDEAVAFLKEHLQPLKLEQSDLDELLKALGSDDEKVWKPAYEKMQYLDPRLAQDIGGLLDAVEGQTARNRLIEILSDFKPDELKDATVMVRRNGELWLFYLTRNRGINRSWYVEPKVTKLDYEAQSRKKSWQRADRAVVLLQHIGTPAAIAILKDMATGNGDARPTNIARLAIDSLGAGEGQ